MVKAMRQDAFKQPYLCTDSTGVLVLQREKCRTGHFWVLVAPPRHVLFEYTPRHDSDAVDDVLAGYKGYIVADAHVVYDHLYASGDVTELALRSEAIGRKNWRLVGSDEGGEVNACFVSLLASCRLSKVEPWSYLRDILCLLPQWPDHRVLELSPVEWAKTRARTDVRRRLEQNPFRKPTLDSGR